MFALRAVHPTNWSGTFTTIVEFAIVAPPAGASRRVGIATVHRVAASASKRRNFNLLKSEVKRQCGQGENYHHGDGNAIQVALNNG